MPFAVGFKSESIYNFGNRGAGAFQASETFGSFNSNGAGNWNGYGDGFLGGPSCDNASSLNPMLGLNSLCGMQNPALQNQLGNLANTMGGQGMTGPNLGGLNGATQAGPQGQGQGGAPVELSLGQSYTTPGGDTITFQRSPNKKKDTEVDVSEAGGGQQSQSCGGSSDSCGGATASVAGEEAVSGPGFSGEVAFAGTVNEGGAGGCASGQPPSGGAPSPASNSQPRSFKVYGDPHIQNPDGSKDNFTQPNGLFTLQDGTRVLMSSGGANKQVDKVQVIPAGSQPNWNGIDPSKTSVYQDNGSGRFQSSGTAAQLQGGGFQGMQ